MIIAPFFNVCYEDVRVLLSSYDAEAVPNGDRLFFVLTDIGYALDGLAAQFGIRESDLCLDDIKGDRRGTETRLQPHLLHSLPRWHLVFPRYLR